MSSIFRADLPSSCDLFQLPGDAPHEFVQWTADEDTGLYLIVAVHSTLRGPAFGGCRMWNYATHAEALADALRLAQGMSLKNALAGLPFGGGKSVIIRPSGTFDRHALFTAFGRVMHGLGGRYITAEDVGTTAADMRAVSQATRYVSGISHGGGFGGDPSPMTAKGVFAAIDEAARRHLKRENLQGATVAVQGLGAVGSNLCALLHGAGARLVVADINKERAAEIGARFGAKVVDVQDVLRTKADVLAPCALGGVFNRSTVDEIHASIVAGAANNQLATSEDGERLHERGVLYLPDFLVNAGGIISVAREYLRTGSEEAVLREIDGIRDRVAQLLERSSTLRQSTTRTAIAWASELLRQRH